MKKIISLALAAMMILAAFTVAFAAPGEDPVNPDYILENLAGKTDLIAGLEATFNCPGDKNGLKTNLLTDGIIAVKNAPAGEVEEKYFNKAYGAKTDVAAIEFAGVDTKALYTFSFEGLGGAKVTSFQVIYSAQNDGSHTGRTYNTQHADQQIMLLVSSDNGKTWTKAYISAFEEGKNVISNVTATKVDDVADYYLVDVTLDKAYDKVTNVVLASPLGRTQVNGYASRISEINVFGEKAGAPVNPTTGDATMLYAVISMAVVAVAATVVIKKKEN